PYNTEATRADIFLMKGIVESLLSRLGIREFEYITGEAQPDFLDPTQLLSNTSGSTPICRMGRIAEKVAKEYDLRNDLWIALLDSSALFALTKKILERPAAVHPLPEIPFGRARPGHCCERSDSCKIHRRRHSRCLAQGHFARRPVVR
ncbi:MAG: hypothetical protein ACHQNE_02430, partial [Candidatus Kapaibacterium sp.]